MTEQPKRNRFITAAWAALVFIDGLFFLENTPAKSLPAAALWLVLFALVGGVVWALGRLGMLTRADAAGQTPLGPRVRWTRGAFWLKIAVATSFGALLALIAPPVNLHWIHWFALVPMMLVLDPDRFWENFTASWTYGTVGLTLIFSWVVQTIALYSNIPAPAAFGVLLLGAGALFGWIYLPALVAIHPLRKRFGSWWVAMFPTLLVASEFFVSFVIIFPYQMGSGHYRNPPVFQLASVTGVWGLTWLVGLTNAALAEAGFRWREGKPLPYRALAAALTLWSANALWGTWRFNQMEQALRDGPSIKVAQLQSPHDMVWRLSRPSRQSFDEWVTRTRKVRPGTADLVVWPEGASAFDLNRGTAHDIVSELARRGGYEMIVGGGTRERTDDPSLGKKIRTFNSVFYFDEYGVMQRRYDKMVPLLFGEYLPWWLNWLHAYVQGIGDFNAGTEPTVFATDHAAISTPICYEAIFGAVCRRYSGANLLVNVTNDAWFGDTAAPHQHGMLAALRATELGVPMIRSAYSGISFVVEPHGLIHSETAPFTEVARITTVRLAHVETLYARFGDWFAWLCVIAMVGVGFEASRRGQTMSTKGESPQGSS